MMLTEIQGTNCVNLVYHRQLKVNSIIIIMVLDTTRMTSDNNERIIIVSIMHDGGVD